MINEDTEYLQELEGCAGSDIVFIGKSSCRPGVPQCIESCDIRIKDSDSDYEGMWSVRTSAMEPGYNAGNFIDNVNVTFEEAIIGW